MTLYRIFSTNSLISDWCHIKHRVPELWDAFMQRSLSEPFFIIEMMDLAKTKQHGGGKSDYFRTFLSLMDLELERWIERVPKQGDQRFIKREEEQLENACRSLCILH